ncbi:MAG: hypothetical protein ACSLFR_15770 [Solirubrobacteraceae bacterium]
MNTSPVDTYEGASDIFTYGAGSFGMWFFLVIAIIGFLGMIAWTIAHENQAFAGLPPSSTEQSMHESAPVGLDPVPGPAGSQP